jgi:hypothetical protein
VRRAGDIRIRKLPCRVEKIDKVAPDVAIVSLKLPANERLQYLAGQYVDLLLKDGQGRWHSQTFRVDSATDMTTCRRNCRAASNSGLPSLVPSSTTRR